MKNGKTCFGVIIGTRAYFNSELAKDVRKQLLKTLGEGGYEYIILPEDATPTGSSSIETREDGLKVSKQFRQHRDEIDGIIVSLPNFGFEIGIINAISDADLNVPVLVQACDDENDKVDLDSRRDAFCGKISVCNNLYQYGIPLSLSLGSDWYASLGLQHLSCQRKAVAAFRYHRRSCRFERDSLCCPEDSGRRS